MVRQTRARRVSNEYSVHTSASGTEGEFMDEDDLDFRSLSSSSSSRDSDDDSSDDDDARRTGSKRVARAEKESPVLVSLSLRSEDHEGDADEESDGSSGRKPEAAVDQSFESATTAGSPERPTGKRKKVQQKQKPPNKEPRYKTSVLHDLVQKPKGIVCLSIDVETAGSAIGIVQLSAVAFDPRSKQMLDKFDEYIDPGKDLVEYWSEAAMDVHKIRPSDLRIKEADLMEEVWPRFVSFLMAQPEL